MLVPLDFCSFDTAGNVAVVVQVCGVLRVLASAKLAARAHACAGGIALEHKCLSSGCHKLHDHTAKLSYLSTGIPSSAFRWATVLKGLPIRARKASIFALYLLALEFAPAQPRR